MPVIRCPTCAHRMVVADGVLGQLVGCSRCERNYEAWPQSRVSRLGELLLIAAALATGLIVGWLILRARG